MHSKLILVCAFVCTVVGHDVTIGKDSGGRKIFDEVRQANPAIWRQIENVTVIAPTGDVISRVVVTDKRPEKDGDAQIVDGGKGQDSVTIELKSPTVLRGYEFQIEVYTEPSTKYTDAEEQLPQNESTTSENGSGDSEVSEKQDNAVTEVPEDSEKDSPALVGKYSDDNPRQARKINDEDESKSSEVDDMVNIPPVESDTSTTELPENDRTTTETEIKEEEVTSAPIMFDNNKNIPDYPALDILDLIKAKEGTRRIRHTDDEISTTEASVENEASTTEFNESYQNDRTTEISSQSNNDDVIDLMPPELGASFNTNFSDDLKHIELPSNIRPGRELTVDDKLNQSNEKDEATEISSKSNNDDVIDLMPPALGASFNTDFSDDSKSTEAPSETRPNQELSGNDDELNESNHNDGTTEISSNANDDVIVLVPPELGASFNTDDSKSGPSNPRPGRGLSVIDVISDVTTEVTTAGDEDVTTTTKASTDEQQRNVRHTDSDNSNDEIPQEPQNDVPLCSSGLQQPNVVLVNGDSLTPDSTKIRFDLPIVLIMGSERNLPTIKIIVENSSDKETSVVNVPMALSETPEIGE